MKGENLSWVLLTSWIAKSHFQVPWRGQQEFNQKKKPSTKQKKLLKEPRTLTPVPAKFPGRFRSHSCPELLDYLGKFAVGSGGWKGLWTLWGPGGSRQEQRETANVREVTMPCILHETLDMLVTAPRAPRLEYRSREGASVPWSPGLNLPKVLTCLTVWIFCYFIWQCSHRRPGRRTLTKPGVGQI